MWNGALNGGIDFSTSTSGLFFHLIQTLPHLAGFDLKTVELISLVFWFGAIVFSAYILALVITPKHFLARIIFVVIYSFNIYLFNTWENIKVANLALVVSLPLFLTIAHLRIYKLVSFRRFLLYLGLASVVASGSGINPAYFIALLFGVTLYFLAVSVYQRGKFKGVLVTFLAFVVVIFLVNSFWILPFAHEFFLANPVKSLTDIGFANWLNSLSENTSLLNVLRLQGAWDWYAKDEFGSPLYIPYSLNYFRNPVFILFSFVIPTLTLISLVVKRKKETVWYGIFAIFLLFGLFLGAGSHEPTGKIYLFLTEKLPFFSFFRSPWYIFMPYLMVAFGGLTSLFWESLTEKFNRPKFLYLSGLILILGLLVYAYPLITGKIFRPGRYDSFFVSFPSYVWETQKWLDEDKGARKRIVSYPDDDLEVFNWGYRGTESILGLFSSREFIIPSFNFTNRELELLLERFYRDIKRGDLASALATLPFLGADTIFTKGDTTSISRKIDLNLPLVNANTEKRDFGPWSFLRYIGQGGEKFFVPKSFYLDLTGNSTFANLAKTLSPYSMTVKASDTEIIKIKDLGGKLGQLIKATRKVRESDPIGAGEYVFTATKDGLYSFYLEDKGTSSASSFTARLFFDGANEIPRSETKEPGFIKFGPINLKVGDHEIMIKFPDEENLIEVENFSIFTDLSNLRKEELPPDLQKTLVIYDQDANNKHFLIPIVNFDPFFKYELSYDYKYFYGNVPIIDIIQSAPTAPVLSIPFFMGSSADWEHKNFVVDPVDVDSKIEVFIKPGSNKGSRSKTFMENIRLAKIYDNNLFVKLELPSPVLGSPSAYKKINPTEYLVEIETDEPYFLVFLENYHPGWQITSALLEAPPIHFSANGYANAWYIQPKVDAGKQQIKVVYKPQDYFKFGLLLSALTLTSLIFVGLRNIRRRANVSKIN